MLEIWEKNPGYNWFFFSKKSIHLPSSECEVFAVVFLLIVYISVIIYLNDIIDTATMAISILNPLQNKTKQFDETVRKLTKVFLRKSLFSIFGGISENDAFKLSRRCPIYDQTMANQLPRYDLGFKLFRLLLDVFWGTEQ